MATLKRTLATLPRTQRGSPLVLGTDPKGINFLYTHGNSVIIRNIENPEISDIYTEHSTLTTVAKYSPSGFYIASADQSGKLRIWDTVNKEHILKNEFQPFVGPVKDISWSPCSQKIVVVGKGWERFGHVINAETGTSIGDIGGQSRPLNSCDFKSSRPFIIITGSEDNTVGVFEGPPFKFKKTLKDHENFVQTVRFSPNGSLFASGDFDGRILIYNTKDQVLKGELGNPSHKGGVYGLAWNPDGKQILSVSGDKTCKLWDVENLNEIMTVCIGNEIEDQQIGCLWQGNFIISVSLSGCLNYLDIKQSKLSYIVQGHNKPITAMCRRLKSSEVLTSSHDGIVTHWDVTSGKGSWILGAGHGNQVNALLVKNETGYSCGIDDTLRTIDIAKLQYTSQHHNLGAQPKAMTFTSNNTLLIATVTQIIILQQDSIITRFPIKYEPSSISCCDSKVNDVAVGGLTDSQVHIYKYENQTLNPVCELLHSGSVTAVTYSPNNLILAAADANRRIICYGVPGYQLYHKEEWSYHTARVKSLAWSPDSKRLASGSLDTNIIIWNPNLPSKHLIIRGAHAQSQINALEWIDNETLVSVGQDSNTRIWHVPA